MKYRIPLIHNKDKPPSLFLVNICQDIPQRPAFIHGKLRECFPQILLDPHKDPGNIRLIGNTVFRNLAEININNIIPVQIRRVIFTSLICKPFCNPGRSDFKIFKYFTGIRVLSKKRSHHIRHDAFPKTAGPGNAEKPLIHSQRRDQFGDQRRFIHKISSPRSSLVPVMRDAAV